MSISRFKKKIKLAKEGRLCSTDKCNAFTSPSNPGELSLETGIVPSSWLSVKSSNTSLVRLPIEAGIGPLKLLEFKFLQKMAWKSFHK